jgi:hypothetical protein
MSDRAPITTLFEMQEKLLRAKNPFARRFGALLAAGALDKHLSELRDEQIGQLISDVVERDLRIASPEAVISSQASRRLLRSEAGSLDHDFDPPLECPLCGSVLSFHIGIDEPDYVECIDMRCKYREYVVESEPE